MYMRSNDSLNRANKQRTSSRLNAADGATMYALNSPGRLANAAAPLYDLRQETSCFPAVRLSREWESIYLPCGIDPIRN